MLTFTRSLKHSKQETAIPILKKQDSDPQNAGRFLKTQGDPSKRREIPQNTGRFLKTRFET
jgi:hypothetical protein